ncbi:MAG: DNA polymerase III subunit beta [Chloroflexi bacterium]|nr:DNA polymerase III subunit beta [Chloroflexota bacterium]
MQVTCDRTQLAAALALVGPAVAKTSTRPILTTVLITATDSALRLTGTDIHMGIRTQFGARVQAPGAIAVPAAFLTDLVKALTGDTVDLSLEPGPNVTMTADAVTVAQPEATTLVMSSDHNRSRIKGRAASEFPMWGADLTGRVTVAAPTLATMIKQVGPAAASEDEQRTVLQAIRLIIEDATITMYAADGVWLAAGTATKDQVGTLNSLVPAAVLRHVPALINGDEEMEIGWNGKRLVFRTATNQLITSVTEGNYPQVQMVIPKDHQLNSRVEAPTAMLRRAVKVVAQFSKGASTGITLGVTTTSLVVNAYQSEDQNSQVEVEDVTVTGECGPIMVNPRYLALALQSIRTDRVSIRAFFASPNPGSCANAITVEPVGSNGIQYVIMPLAPEKPTVKAA